MKRISWLWLCLFFVVGLLACSESDDGDTDGDLDRDGTSEVEAIDGDADLPEVDQTEAEADQDTEPQRRDWIAIGETGVEIMAREMTTSAFVRCVRNGACESDAFGQRADNNRCTFDNALKQSHPMACAGWRAAYQACQYIEARLCTEQEWGAACGGPDNHGFPYGPAYGETTCNGADAGNDESVVVGTLSGCEGGYSDLFDMSGNVSEWLHECETEGETERCKLAGGGWDAEAADLKCTSIEWQNTSYWTASMGIRCCRDE